MSTALQIRSVLLWISLQTLQAYKHLHVIKLNFVRVCLESVAKTAESSVHEMEPHVQFGKCTEYETREITTIGPNIADHNKPYELKRVSSSVPIGTFRRTFTKHRHPRGDRTSSRCLRCDFVQRD